MNAIPAPVEYLYGIDSSVADDARFYEPPRVVRFRIMKRTAKRVYYVRHEDIERLEIGFVDRQKLEADGQVTRASGGWWESDLTVYLEPPELLDRKKPDLPTLKAAMAAAHPDRGGSDAAFIEARTAYEKARKKGEHL